MPVETNKTSLVPSHLFLDRPAKPKRLDVSMLTNQALLSGESCWKFPGQIYLLHPGSGLETMQRVLLNGFYFSDLHCPEWCTAAVLFGGGIAFSLTKDVCSYFPSPLELLSYLYSYFQC